MTNAPERIWVDGQDYWATPTFKADKTEYVRVDMLHEIFIRYSKKETDRIEELTKERDEWQSLAEAAIKDDAAKNVYYAEMNAKLAKAVEALEAGVICTTKHGGAAEFLRIARTTLAELKGEQP